MLEGRTILLVEDEVMVNLMAAQMLRDLGAAEVLSATSLAQGLVAAEQTLDLAVLDVNLRGERSFPIAEVLTERNVPFIYATAYDVEAMQDGPPAPILNKPYDASGLESALRALLNGEV